MKYVINTLHIELYKQLEAIRVTKRYSAYPEYNGDSTTYERNAAELQKAIAHFEDRGTQPTSANSDYEAALRISGEFIDTLTNTNCRLSDFCAWLRERLHSAENTPNVS